MVRAFSSLLALVVSSIALWGATLGAGRGLAEAAETELLVIAHPAAPVTSLDRDELAAIFTLSSRRWDSGKPIVPFNYDPKDARRERFDRAVLGLDATAVARFWIDFRVRGQGTAPRTVPTPALMARVVARLPGAIGYVPADEPLADVRVVARVVNGQVVAPGP